jgi:hypothetical protein
MLTHDLHEIDGTAFTRSPLRAANELLMPGRVVRSLARARRHTLDRAIAQGADPAGSGLLAARTTQLTDRPGRGRVAYGLEQLVDAADGSRRRSRVTPSRRAVAANRAELLALAAALRDPGLVYARGVAMLGAIVADGTGPAYTDRTGALLADRLRHARAALDG